jgi:NAD(P) transhydrogenase subunit beta
MSQFILDIVIAAILIVGISQFRTPRGARFGNLTAAFALLCAIGVVLVRYHVGPLPLIAVGAALGLTVGWALASRVNMIQIPSMVAFQHGMGGVAAFLVSFVELTRTSGEPLSPMAEVSALLGLFIGAATFSGSMLASGKLANKLRQTPVTLPAHNLILVGLATAILLLSVAAGLTSNGLVVCVLAVLLIGVSVAIGIVFSMRIGGADMPVLISFLNATAGLAAAFCGLTIGSRLLIICGATVAASGSVLTHVMCRAMNRHLASIFSGHWQQPQAAVTAPAASSPQVAAPPTVKTEVTPAAAPAPAGNGEDPFARVLAIAKSAQQIIFVPGYGMALADAQEEVSHLADKLTGMGKKVMFAIHPVAGRMPGHMHVLLAEAEVDYGMIRELADVNAEFAQTDLVLIVGACDVVNPAAIMKADTPISGMPILRAHEARNVVVCNLDERPGYSGVENPLYRDPRTIMLLGDAKTTVGRILAGINGSAGA